MVIVSKQVFADVVYTFWPIGWMDATGVTDGVGVPVGVVVSVVVGVAVLVGVTVGVTVLVGVTVGVTVLVGVTLLVGVGVMYIISPSTHPLTSVIFITMFVSSYGDGTSNVNGNTDTVATGTQLALNELQ